MAQMERTGLALPACVLEWLRVEAERRGCTVSFLIRSLIEKEQRRVLAREQRVTRSR
jgi:hypothetical protein